MRNSKKAMLAGGLAATAAGLGYAARKRRENKNPYRRFINKLEDYLD